jgi:hypothetical protein
MSEDLKPYGDERLTASAKRINWHCRHRPNLASLTHPVPCLFYTFIHIGIREFFRYRKVGDVFWLYEHD